MKRQTISMVMAAIAITAGAVSCNKKEAMPAAENAGEKTEMTVNVDCGQFTKAGIVAENEKKVNNVQIFVFRKDGELDAYASSETSSGIKISCTTGEKDIVAIVNAPDLKSYSTRTDLLTAKSLLADNSLENFVMTGEKTDQPISAEEVVTIEVKRLVARVAVNMITPNFTSPAYRDMEFKVVRIYAVNVVGDLCYGGSSEPTLWHNQMKYTAGETDALIYDDIEDTAMTPAKPYSGSRAFYVYPNRTETDSQSNTFGPRYTRLVIETTLGGKTYYYPVSIKGIESNKTYNITDLTITRPGSLSPDVPVTAYECTFGITVVEEWQEGADFEYEI